MVGQLSIRHRIQVDFHQNPRTIYESLSQWLIGTNLDTIFFWGGSIFDHTKPECTISTSSIGDYSIDSCLFFRTVNICKTLTTWLTISKSLGTSETRFFIGGVWYTCRCLLSGSKLAQNYAKSFGPKLAIFPAIFRHFWPNFDPYLRRLKMQTISYLYLFKS